MRNAHAESNNHCNPDGDDNSFWQADPNAKASSNAAGSPNATLSDNR